MPWIPYTYDNDVFAGIAILWAISLTLWMIRARRRRLAVKSYVKGAALSIVAAIACLIFYSGYILSRQVVEASGEVTSEDDLKALSEGLLNYAQAHNNHLPPAGKWASDCIPYIDPSDNPRNLLQCPECRTPYCYAFNKALGGLSLDAIRSQASTVLLFECDAKTINATGSAGDLVRFRHIGESYVCFADGHVQGVNIGTAPSLNWKP